MNRRSFIQFAASVIGGVSALKLTQHRMPKWDWRTGRLRSPTRITADQGFIAGRDIRTGDYLYLRYDGRGNSVAPVDSNRRKIIGMAMNDANRGQSVRLLVQGEGVVRFG